MIPLSISLSGFLSYRDPVEIDFTHVELACIAGPNGAGKSSLLDAITWALFGQARKRDESLINTATNAAEVTFIFSYEGSLYKLRRAMPRGKTTMLELHIAQVQEIENQTLLTLDLLDNSSWKPLTEATLRATQSRIEEILRLDYDTFVNASFFLQGKADQFTQQRPADRKRILASILGLEVWESYRQRSAEHRKKFEERIAIIDGRLAEIAAELAEEDLRKDHLADLEKQLTIVQGARQKQEKYLENLRKVEASLQEQRKLVDALARQVDAASRQLDNLSVRLESRRKEKDAYADVLARAAEIQAAREDWLAARSELEAWDSSAVQFREHEARRQPFLDELNAIRAGLLQEQKTLVDQEKQIEAAQAECLQLNLQASTLQQNLQKIEEALEQRSELENQLQQARQNQAEARAENPRLKGEMDELKARIDQLHSTEGATCPLCGQPLNEAERQHLIDNLNLQGKEMGDRYRANLALLKDADQQIADYETRIEQFSGQDAERLQVTQDLAALNARLEQAQQLVADWEALGSPRLVEITEQLQLETFSPETRASLAALDAELAELGYDAAAHDNARRREQEGRSVEDDLRSIERAEAALTPLEREITELDDSYTTQQDELMQLQAEHGSAAASLAEVEASVPDLYEAESEMLSFQEQENRLRLEVGAAQQKVTVLDDLRARRKALDAEREGQALLVGQHKQLERAFGKDGVPALLIEQALPQIEMRANDLLERLSGGNMTVRFVTQASYKDKKRKDLKETLDIQISDSAGMRDYEMFSGGEAFRVNFAIRLALSEVLAQRAGARLQTLVIDEGFGSQDALGRQRLIEAINIVKPDFAKILVITHIDELKDAFPTRIEVEKTERGSSVIVV